MQLVGCGEVSRMGLVPIELSQLHSYLSPHVWILWRAVPPRRALPAGDARRTGVQMHHHDLVEARLGRRIPPVLRGPDVTRSY
jgi:hypothetical protein